MDSLDSSAEWLRQRRRDLDLNRDELAQCMGLSVSGPRKISANERRPSQQMAELLAPCLQVRPGELRCSSRWPAVDSHVQVLNHLIELSLLLLLDSVEHLLEAGGLLAELLPRAPGA